MVLQVDYVMQAIIVQLELLLKLYVQQELIINTQVVPHVLTVQRDTIVMVLLIQLLI